MFFCFIIFCKSILHMFMSWRGININQIIHLFSHLLPNKKNYRTFKKNWPFMSRNQRKNPECQTVEDKKQLYLWYGNKLCFIKTLFTLLKISNIIVIQNIYIFNIIMIRWLKDCVL